MILADVADRAREERWPRHTVRYWPDRPGRLPRARPFCLWRGPSNPLAVAVDAGSVHAGPYVTGWVVPFTALTMPG